MTLLAGHEVAPLTDAELLQIELAEVDQQFHDAYGADESGWLPLQWRAYFNAIDAAWAAHGRCPTCSRTFEDCRCTGVTA